VAVDKPRGDQQAAGVDHAGGVPFRIPGENLRGRAESGDPPAGARHRGVFEDERLVEVPAQ